MDQRLTSPPSRVRRSRAEQKQETREALTMAALMAFARDGYHGASLDGIAGEAGFSKGAVYSNFGGKAELFLAAMDHNLQALRGEDWDPFAVPDEGDTAGADSGVADSGVAPAEEAAMLVRGFGLAMLEFIATAARDAALGEQLRDRVQIMIGAYGRIAAESRPAGENLPVDDVAQLMAALDQGVSVLALSGVASVDGALLRTGLRRLVDPSGAADDPTPSRTGRGTGLPDVERVQRLARDTDF
ncbi:TetR/AcrR family transcriptional regulator [Streptomyces sp. NPDC053750]|uniref:TetR/AcrR family transcriptional regulator n=1 Tax=Streptomyces sp. NPDC053750 TaxID=3365714 RepID=UPI0037D51D02